MVAKIRHSVVAIERYNGGLQHGSPPSHPRLGRHQPLAVPPQPEHFREFANTFVIDRQSNFAGVDQHRCGTHQLTDVEKWAECEPLALAPRCATIARAAGIQRTPRPPPRGNRYVDEPQLAVGHCKQHRVADLIDIPIEIAHRRLSVDDSLGCAPYRMLAAAIAGSALGDVQCCRLGHPDGHIPATLSRACIPGARQSSIGPRTDGRTVHIGECGIVIDKAAGKKW